MVVWSVDELRCQKAKLDRALRLARSMKWCLTLWSRFVRARDAHRCVACGSNERIQAHHIFRKSTYERGRFELGNGITLCQSCHQVPHAHFNSRADLRQPLGAQGGDDQDEMAFLYGALLDDADERNLSHDDFYGLSNEMLQFFVAVQGYESLYWAVQEGRISRLRMAHEIWRSMPEGWYTDVVQKIVELNFVEDDLR